MNNNDENLSFSYTYSAKEQDEIRNIRKKYSSPAEDKMDRLRRLDKSAAAKASAVSLVVGIVGCLLLGFGMSLAMTDIGGILGMNEPLLFGIVIGVIGIVILSLAYPIYNRTLKKARERIAPEILRLTDELLK